MYAAISSYPNVSNSSIAGSNERTLQNRKLGKYCIYVCMYVCMFRPVAGRSNEPLCLFGLRKFAFLESRVIAIAIAIIFRVGQTHGLHYIHHIL